jgi:hypothetical protein
MADVNIEVAHIYADETCGSEQLQSIDIYKQVVAELLAHGKTFVTCALVDDRMGAMFNEKKFIEMLGKHGAKIDFIGYESQLGKDASTAWTLARLGEKKISVKSFTKKDFAAKEITTILPEKYSMEEKDVLMAVKKLCPAREKDITYEFFEEKK